MASCEYITYTADCPCGLGTLEREVESPNYPYGRVSVSTPKFNCTHCQPHWTPSADGLRLNHVSRNSCPTKKALSAVGRFRHQLIEQLDTLKAEALRRELQSSGAKSKAAEHRYLVGRGLFEGSYGSYLRAGQWWLASRIDPAQLPSCATVLTQLRMADQAIQSLETAFDLWLDENRHKVEFQLHWR